MQRKEANQGYAEISLEAETLATQAMATNGTDFSRPISEVRASLREANAAASGDAIEVTRVSLSERIIEGVPCMIIDPPIPHGNRDIIYLFGGGFSVGSPFEDLPISAKLAEKTGARVVAPYYPLAPENPFPAALNTCEEVISTLLIENPEACLCGESAGGNLALATVHRLKARGERLPRALALMSPWVDLKKPGDSGVAQRDPFLREPEIHAFRSYYVPKNADLTKPDLSPIYGPFDDRFPPVFVTSGTRDHLLSGCVRLERLMRESGATCDLRVWEGMWHVFEFYPGIPEAEASITEIAEFLARNLPEITQISSQNPSLGFFRNVT